MSEAKDLSHPSSIPASQTALLVCDFQNMILKHHTGGDPSGVINKARVAITAAREAGAKIIYIIVAFRDGHVEASENNKAFKALKASKGLVEGSEGAAIHPDIAPDLSKGDVVVTKRRFSSFAGSDLQVILQAHNIKSLLIGGVRTAGVVLSTVRAAADMDYVLGVVADMCADADPEIHNVLLNKVLPIQAHIVQSADIATILKK